MAVAYQKFNVFPKDLVNGVHNFSSHTFKLLLSNTAPVATNAVKGDLTEITAQNGYAAGGPAMPVTVTLTGGTLKITGTSETLTAAGGSFGPYRYVSLYNDSVASPVKPLVCFWDYGSSLSTNDTEQFIFTPDATNGVFTIA